MDVKELLRRLQEEVDDGLGRRPYAFYEMDEGNIANHYEGALENIDDILKEAYKMGWGK